MLQAPESNDPTATRYIGQCWQNLSVMDKILFNTKQVHIQPQNMEQEA